jgi:hypothetical protein
MSTEHFDRLLTKCTASDREYEIMKTSVITPSGESGKSRRTVVIRCEPADAQLVLGLARRLYPSAVRRGREYSA